MKHIIHTIIFLLFVTVCYNGVAEEDFEEGEETEETIEPAEYIEIKPSIVTNYLDEKLAFVKTDVALKARGRTIDIIRNIPRIKHLMIQLLSQQNFETLSSPEGVIVLKQLALEEINTALEEENSDVQVEEVLFTGLLVE